MFFFSIRNSIAKVKIICDADEIIFKFCVINPTENHTQTHTQDIMLHLVISLHHVYVNDVFRENS